MKLKHQLSLKERDRRYKSVRASMEKRGLSYLLVAGDSGKYDSNFANIRYLTMLGGNGEEGFLIFPLDGDPVYIAWIGGHGLKLSLKFRTWIDNVKVGYPHWSQAILETLKETGMQHSEKVGVVGLGGEIAVEGTIRYVTFEKVKRSLRSSKFENATEILEQARLIKSEEEIECLRIGARIDDKANEALLRAAKPGVNELEAHAAMHFEMLKEGSEQPLFFIWESGRSPVHASKDMTGRTLREGDVILTEFGSKYCGYHSHTQRPVAVGKVPKEYQQLYDVAIRAYQEAFEKVRPGMTIEELDYTFNKPVSDAGYVYLNPHFHGVGLETPEYPYGRNPSWSQSFSNPNTRIQAGWVIAFQPMAVKKDLSKGIHVGDPVVVTSNGAKRLSRLPLDFLVS